MINFSGKRWLVVSVVSFLTLFFVSQANHYTAGFGIHFFVVGMIVSFCALELSYFQGLCALAPIALHLDSKSPLPFGFSLALMLSLFTAAHALRTRVRREVTASALLSSLALNILAFLGYTLAAVYYLGGDGIHLWTCAANLFASLAVVVLLNRIFFETQIGVLAILGVDLAAEQREQR